MVGSSLAKSSWSLVLVSALSLALAGCPQVTPPESPPTESEFCAASGRIEGEGYEGVICLAPVDPIAQDMSGGGYTLQPGPIRFVLPVEPAQ